MMSGLTEEQKRRIEENRRIALAKRAGKLSQPQPQGSHSKAQAVQPVRQPVKQNALSVRDSSNFDKGAPPWNKMGRHHGASSHVMSPVQSKGNGQTMISLPLQSKHGGQNVSSTLPQSRPTFSSLQNKGTYNVTGSSLSKMINASSAQQIHVKSSTGSNIVSQGNNGNSNTESKDSLVGTVARKPGNSFSSGAPSVTNRNQLSCVSGNSFATSSHKSAFTSNFSMQNKPTWTPVCPTNNISATKPETQTTSNFYKNSTATDKSSGTESKSFAISGNKMSHQSGNPQTVSSMTTKSENSLMKLMKGSALKGAAVLISRDRFILDIGYYGPLVEICKTMQTRQYDAVTKKWDFKLQDYEEIMSKARVLMQEGAIEMNGLPKPILQAFKNAFKGIITDTHITNTDLSSLPETLSSSLMPFQRDGVNFAVSREGRVIIADDMGLGKTIQAICVACYYKKEWPLLIVVPSSVRFAWAQQLQRWVPHLSADDINVVLTGKDSVTTGKVVIVSYDLMAKKKNALQQQGFRIAILDESHFLKNFRTARCQAAQLILKTAKRVLLLSGTPALSRPAELYTQLKIVRPQLFQSFHEFGVRYCDAKQNAYGWDYSGSSNLTELQLLLEETIMIRRLKKDVLKQLPAKRRQMVLLDPELVKIDKNLKTSAKLLNSSKIKGSDRHGFLLSYFHDTGQAKVKAVRDYVLELLESEHKFLVFAHHQEMLDAIEEAVKKQKYKYIRIDGKTGPEQRNFFCQKFQTQDDVMVAILSITAANAGLNLTSASLVVFAELFWNPGILVQAEDRCHRIGQEDSVNIHYLVAKNTADDYIWPLVQRKLAVLGKVGLSKEDFSEADTTILKDSKQKDILSYFEESFIEDCDLPGSHDHAASENIPVSSAAIHKTNNSGEQKSMLQFVSKESTVKRETPMQAAKSDLLVGGVLEKGGGLPGSLEGDDELTDFLEELDEDWDEPAVKKTKWH